MASYELHIKATLPARNLDSANNKLQALKETMERKGWEACELSLTGTSSSLASGPGFPKAQRLQKTSTKERHA